ncbi:unnamed protein product, partial [Mycena citricolor]
TSLRLGTAWPFLRAGGASRRRWPRRGCSRSAYLQFRSGISTLVTKKEACPCTYSFSAENNVERTARSNNLLSPL